MKTSRKKNNFPIIQMDEIDRDGLHNLFFLLRNKNSYIYLLKFAFLLTIHRQFFFLLYLVSIHLYSNLFNQRMLFNRIKCFQINFQSKSSIKAQNNTRHKLGFVRSNL